MDSIRQIDRRTLLLWALLLSLALLCSQGIRLHIHNHGHDHTHTDSIDGADDHGHLSNLSNPHFAHDTSHNDHHNGTIFEMDISPDRVSKTPSDNIFAVVLFTFFFTLITSVFSRQLVQCRRESRLVLHKYYTLSPPLRAPPQH